jgi:carboxymethylenebutenolidase
MERTDHVVVDGSEMDVYMAVPEGKGPHPGVLVAFHRGGMDEFTIDRVDRLAEAGFAACAPDFYHRRKGEPSEEAVQHRLDAEIVADLQATVAHLRGLPEVDGDRLAIVGHCMGGRVAFLGAAALNDVFQACVPCYSGGVLTAWGNGPTVFDRFKDIRCPVMGCFGNEDRNPSPADVDKFEVELARFGVPYVFHRYDGAGHAFQNFISPKSYRAGPAQDSWEKTLAFLSTKLGLQPRAAAARA